MLIALPIPKIARSYILNVVSRMLFSGYQEKKVVLNEILPPRTQLKQSRKKKKKRTRSFMYIQGTV